MKWSVLLALALVGCKSNKPTPPPARPVLDAYRTDIANLCDAVKLSGADKVQDDQRIPLIAMWLGPNIKTQEGRDFLVHIQPLTGEPKAKALEDEAHRVGLSGCALAAEWRK